MHPFRDFVTSRWLCASLVVLAFVAGGCRSGTPSKTDVQLNASPEDIRRLLPGEWQLQFSHDARPDKVKFFFGEDGSYRFSERWLIGEFVAGSGKWRLEGSDIVVDLTQSYRSEEQSDWLRLHVGRISEHSFWYRAGDGVERCADRVVPRPERTAPKTSAAASDTNSPR